MNYLKNIRLLLLICIGLTMTSCGTYRYSNPGKAKYTKHRGGHWVKQSKNNQDLAQGQFEEKNTGSAKVKRSISNTTSVSDTSGDWDFWVTPVACVFGILVLAATGGPTWMIVALATVLGVYVVMLIVLIVLVKLLWALIEAIFGF